MRRQAFLAATIAALAAISLKAMPVSGVPKLWGDGKHDDADGLEAYLNGRPYRDVRDGLVKRGGEMSGRHFLLKRTIYVTSDDGPVRDFHGNLIEATPQANPIFHALSS